MLNIKNNKLLKILLGVWVTIIITCGVVKVVESLTYNFQDEKWVTPFESVVTTEYSLGNGFTAKSTTTSVTTINSVKHSDESLFSAKQWSEILSGIADGSIVWED